MFLYDSSKKLSGADSSKLNESYKNNYDKNEKIFDENGLKNLEKINYKNCKFENAIQDLNGLENDLNEFKFNIKLNSFI